MKVLGLAWDTETWKRYPGEKRKMCNPVKQGESGEPEGSLRRPQD